MLLYQGEKLGVLVTEIPPGNYPWVSHGNRDKMALCYKVKLG